VRIAWCTPFSPESAIGMVSEMAVEALARRDGVEVDVWHPARSAGRTWSGTTRVLDPHQAEVLEDYDHVVFHLGDHSWNHLDLWKASLRVPGLVILHDVAMANLFHGHLLERGDYPQEYGRWYGPEVQERADRALAGEPGEAPWLEDHGAAFPFLSLAAEGARQVVVHSEFAAARVRDAVLADVVVVGLPVAPAAPAPPTAAAEDPLPHVPAGVPVVLQAGVLNPNKRIDVVVAAMARLASERSAHLVIAGRPGVMSVEEVRAVVDAQGLTDVTLIDSPSDATLAAVRLRADVAVVLREPCLEGASYALLESLAAGLPTVVVDDGSYAEVRGAFVEHVRTPPQPGDVATAVGALLERGATDLAPAARAHIVAHHTPEAYADGVLRVLRDVPATAPRARLVANLSEVLHSWGLADVPGALDTVATRVEELFGATPTVLPPR
jgi:glycosyltransferase involved in cell wall biosynthesis